MAWFKKIRRAIPARPTSSRPPEGKWAEFPACSQLLYDVGLAESRVCAKCGHRLRIGEVIASYAMLENLRLLASQGAVTPSENEEPAAVAGPGAGR